MAKSPIPLTTPATGKRPLDCAEILPKNISDIQGWARQIGSSPRFYIQRPDALLTACGLQISDLWDYVPKGLSILYTETDWTTRYAAFAWDKPYGRPQIFRLTNQKPFIITKIIKTLLSLEAAQRERVAEGLPLEKDVWQIVEKVAVVAHFVKGLEGDLINEIERGGQKVYDAIFEKVDCANRRRNDGMPRALVDLMSGMVCQEAPAKQIVENIRKLFPSYKVSASCEPDAHSNFGRGGVSPNILVSGLIY
jgi:hypothetical protein